jgi:CHAT domain-containing protein/tetratricopeptide (TPR) repeat protein
MRRLIAALRYALLLASVQATFSHHASAQESRSTNDRSVTQAQPLDDLIERSKEELVEATTSLGPGNPQVISKVDELADFLDRRGRTQEAEALLRESASANEKAKGAQAIAALQTKEKLASYLRKQGKYAESEGLLKEVLGNRRAVQGGDHLDTLRTANSLSGLLRVEGKYGEAERLIAKEVEIRRRIQGDKNGDTLTAINNLATIYFEQSRYDEAEPLLRENLQSRKDTLGDHDPATFRSMNNLASAYRLQKRNDLAEPLLRDALALRRKYLGPDHPDTLSSMNNLALVLRDQKKFAESEELLTEVLAARRKSPGPDDPDTLLIMNNLSVLSRMKGEYGPAEDLLGEARERSVRRLGSENPLTMAIHTNSVLNFIAARQLARAASVEKQIEQSLLSYLGSELYSTKATSARRQLVDSQASFQDVALSFALLPDTNDDAILNATSIVLHFKGLATEESAFLSHLVREGGDPRVRALAQDIAALHNKLSLAFQAGQRREGLSALSSQLDRMELELGGISREFTQALQSRAARVADVQAKLDPDDCLLEIRQYRPVDFVSGESGEPRFAGILIEHSGRIRVRDLGMVSASTDSVVALSDRNSDEDKLNAATLRLHDQLLAPLAEEWRRKRRLYVAPDGILYLVPFGALSDGSGHRVVEGQDVRLLQTARDILRAPAERTGQGLVALGGIDFGARPQVDGKGSPAATAPEQMASATDQAAGAVAYAREAGADAFRSGFGPLKFSKPEVEGIGMLYRLSRPDEPGPQIVTGADATKTRLMNLERPPRVLHLATHAFFRPSKEPADQPLLLSGVALAHANDTLTDKSAPGLLYGIEFLDMNLEGTELAVLSACETAQGQIDYGEGLSGLVQALRTAGARIVIVTLRPVEDEAAEEFMTLFYHHWLSQDGDDPASAFREAQLDSIGDAIRAPGAATWSNFIMIGG